MRFLHIFRVFTILVLSSAGVAWSAELIVVEQTDCPYCDAFNREISVAYPNTAEGKRAPIRRIDLHERWPANLLNIPKATFTPTFILIDNDQEIARIHGYPGDEHFWFLLNEMLDKLEELS